jgi:hypothetical protein
MIACIARLSPGSRFSPYNPRMGLFLEGQMPHSRGLERVFCDKKSIVAAQEFRIVTLMSWIWAAAGPCRPIRGHQAKLGRDPRGMLPQRRAGTEVSATSGTACLSHASKSSCSQLPRSCDRLTRPLRSSPITSLPRSLWRKNSSCPLPHARTSLHRVRPCAKITEGDSRWQHWTGRSVR